MNLQQVVPPRSSANGFGRRRADRETVPKPESKMHSGKSASSSFASAVNGGTAGRVPTPSRDRLVYVFSHLIGMRVEVHVRNGSVISGIFHTTSDKDCATVLKMAQVIKDGSTGGEKPISDAVKKPVDMIIQAKDLVQIVAEDVALNIEEFSERHNRDKRKDIMIDSAISHSNHLERQRELGRWIPDADDPDCPELENIFDGTWNRNWDQFETNEALFGVKSTFDEELYTTKLAKGPQMRDLEREAARIAREIEGEDTRDLHLAEERGIQFDEDLDEEIKYSAVQREIVDQTEESQHSYLDVYETDSFVSSGGSAIPRSYSDMSRNKFIEEAYASSTSSSVDVEAFVQIHSAKDAHHSSSGMPLADVAAKKSLAFSDKSRLGEQQITNQDKEKNLLNEFKERTAPEKAQTSQKVQSLADAKAPSSSTDSVATSCTGQDNKHSISEPPEVVSAAHSGSANSSSHPETSASSTSERMAAGSSGPSLSPCSSVGSLSSEKSTLNPYAKEFKLNPNAKSFSPSAPFRPQVPVPDGSFYYPTNNLSGVPPMRGVPMSIGIGPSYGGHQPVFSSQSAPMQSPQAYIHPNGQVYGQHMILGQPRPVYYMPAYPPDMPYKGRNF